MRVTILDYGAGNLHSLAKALSAAGGDVSVEREPLRALDTDVLVLPGVGAFSAAASHIANDRETLRRAIAAGLPTLGICLGMQLLFDSSEEGPGRGLGVMPGVVERIRAIRVPHMGWNRVSAVAGAEQALESAYFANSFVCRPMNESIVAAWSEQDGDRFPAAVRAGATLGVQYHPEKSSRAGIGMLECFLNEVAA
ncbi:MAG TPA: imidazole glycerol phosphate synthase subunit HisH [Gemmatimonadaceae bacterium]